MKIRNIRTKFLIVLIPLFLVSFVILSSISYYVANKSLTMETNETAGAMGEKFSWQVKAEIDGKMNMLNEMAVNPVFHTNDAEAKVKFMAEACKRTGFPTVTFIGLDGKGVGSDGVPIVRTDREFYKKEMETKKPYVGAPVISSLTHTLMVALVTPIMENGQMVGMITGTIDLAAFSKELQSVKLKETGYGYIVDNTGLIIAHPNNPEFINKLNISEKNINPEFNTKNKQLDDRYTNAFKEVEHTGNQVTVNYIELDGQDHKAVLTPIEISGKRWVMVVTAPMEEITAEVSKLANVMLGVSILFILLAIATIFVFSKNIAKQIACIRDECLEIDQGDLRDKESKIHTEDEIGQLAQGFVSMRKKLGTLVSGVQAKAEQVAAASEELTAGAEQSAEASNQVAISITEIAQGVTKQSTAADNVDAVAKDISHSADEISAKAQEVVQIAQATSKEANQGRESIAKAVNQMQEIGEGSKAIQQAIVKLDKGSQEISNIVELISSIAGQTNLLALNAAIEAARAGEAGRGFAVVAEEVRKLAEESNQSSQKIGELVKRNQVDMEDAVIASKAGTEKVVIGIESVTLADETFKNIVNAVGNLTEQIAVISEAIHKMAKGSATMLTSIEQIDKVSKTNAAESQAVSAATEEQSAAMQEIASASQNLANLAMELQEAISIFRV